MSESSPGEVRHLNLHEASNILQVSSVTLRNWVKSGLIKGLYRVPSSSGFIFDANDIIDIKEKIQSGEITRLRKRANKNQNGHRHVHRELLEDKQCEAPLRRLLASWGSRSKELLLAIYLRQLVEIGLARAQHDGFIFVSATLKAEIAAWEIPLHNEHLLHAYAAVDASTLNFSNSLLAFVSQALSFVGEKQKKGAYYTPVTLIRKMLAQTLTSSGSFLDPCCGSGNFLVGAYHQLKVLGVPAAHTHVFGADLDPNAVLLARASLTLASDGQAASVRQIVCRDSIFNLSRDRRFDFICTNPPWGFHFSKAQEKKLRVLYPQIRSRESFSYFLLMGMACLRSRGTLSFVLPESFLNVKLHAELRKFILQNYRLLRVSAVSEKFSGVFTRAVVLTMSKEKPPRGIPRTNDDRIPLSGQTINDEILRHIDAQAHCFLKRNAEWALGVVTGDNEKFLSKKPKVGCEPILKGTNVFRFHLSPPTHFIRFERAGLQQVAPEFKYRATEKLVYRFICKELVFAIDREQRVTLNSANVLLPNLPGYSIRSICGILNSRLGQFYYQKKFHSIKTLRGNIENFPFPRPDTAILLTIDQLVQKLEVKFSPRLFRQLDTEVMRLYQIPPQWRGMVSTFSLSKAFN